jgi:hypothetical protein
MTSRREGDRLFYRAPDTRPEWKLILIRFCISVAQLDVLNIAVRLIRNQESLSLSLSYRRNGGVHCSVYSADFFLGSSCGKTRAAINPITHAKYNGVRGNVICQWYLHLNSGKSLIWICVCA